MERRDLLDLFSRAAKAGLLASSLSLRHLPALQPVSSIGNESVEAAVSISENYRRLWSTTPNQDLIDPVLGHLHLISRLLASAASEKDQATLARAASEQALLAAWLAEDLWELDAVSRRYRVALAYAERSGSNLLQAYVAYCMSYWATRRSNGTEAVKLAEQAKRRLSREAQPAARAWIAVREATAHATAHDISAMLDALNRAERALNSDQAGEADGEPAWPWVFPMNYQEISRHRGLAAASLGLPEMAIPALNEGLEAMGPEPTKRRAYTLGKLAEVYVHTGDVERACDLGAEAFAMAVRLGDTETVMAVRNARVDLSPASKSRAVRELDERLTTILLSLPSDHTGANHPG